MKNKITLSVAALALISTPSVFAQDNSQFSGPYAGIQVGVSQIETKHSDADYWYYGGQNEARKDTGVQVGVKAGYDFVSGPLLAGVLAEAQFGKVNSYTEYKPSEPAFEIGTKVTALGSVRAKLGLTSGKLAAFATGGLAFSNAKQAYAETDGTGEYFNGKGDRTGYVFGAGAAYAMSETSSFGVDLSRYSFGKREHLLIDSDGSATSYRWQLNDKVESVTISYNLHF